ncbi:MAG: TetR/AcrR family transcriptional regulator [Janthinobacterium lividum]
MLHSSLGYSPEQTRYEHPRIVKTAKNMFLQRGIEAVTLEDIACSLRMPLGAIERHFPAGKPALVQAALQHHLATIHQRLAQQHLDSTNAVEELLVMLRSTQQGIGDAGVLVFHELEEYYPFSWRYFRYVRARFMLAYLRANLQRGVQEGLYYPGLDADDLSQK